MIDAGRRIRFTPLGLFDGKDRLGASAASHVIRWVGLNRAATVRSGPALPGDSRSSAPSRSRLGTAVS